MELFWKLTWISVFGFGFIVGFYTYSLIGDDMIKIMYGCEKNLTEYFELLTFIDPTESISNLSPERIAVYEKEQELIKNNCELEK